MYQILFLYSFNLNSSFSNQSSGVRIIGGSNINITSVPYQVSLQNVGSNFHTCGGSILAPSWILTAAHCVRDFDPLKKQIVVGMTLRSKGGIIHSIKRVVQHPLGSAHKYSHDIALIELNTPITFNALAQPVRLPEDDEPLPVGSVCRISGWGRLEHEGDKPDQLQSTTVPIWKPKKCAAAYKYSKSLFDGIEATMMCAGWENGGSDTCSGDSGGGLVCGDAVYGIVSFGKGCGTVYPKVFSHVYNLREFVESVIG
ncbi:LOW QUALITY PROTEIN: trypsin-5-like [Atheta coriaria]|uniref:LOW QUALITY PROTEIN: trypsin-5-like n=1 Tax=Dalotia coriaria TaxID=877792 RepID=UPI0031F3BEF2